MTLTVARAPLAAALAELRRGLHRATTIPVLRTIRLEAAHGVLTCLGTDMDQWRETAVPCQGHLPACCPDGERIAAAVSSAAGAEVALALSGDRLAVRHDAGRGAVACLAADEFPRRPRTEPAATVDVDGADLAALVGRIAHAVSTERARYYLRGAFLELDAAGGRLLLTACDGYRIAHSCCPAVISGDAATAVIVPPRALETLAKAKGTVRLSLTERQLEAAWDGSVLATRLIDGTFPDWRRSVPQADPEPVAIDLGALGEAVGRVAWAADDKHASVWLSVNGAGSYVASRGGSGQEARAALDVSSPRLLAGGFDARQLRDACGAIGGRAALTLGAGRVLRLDPADRPDDRFVVAGVVMDAIEEGAE